MIGLTLATHDTERYGPRDIDYPCYTDLSPSVKPRGRWSFNAKTAIPVEALYHKTNVVKAQDLSLAGYS